ncbi:MAG: DUF3553 domain-containing protein [Phycisphaerae bacterium]
MSELACGPELVGQKVFNPARPDWGVGQVLRVQTTHQHGAPQHRVSVQFPVVGHKLLMVPPARLTAPPKANDRRAGWLDTLDRKTLDDQLRALHEDATDPLAPVSDRVALFGRLYAHTDDPGALVRWAREQTQVADPLTLWTRDELAAAFAEFARRRDEAWRQYAASAERRGADLPRLLASLDEAVAAAMRSASSGRR